MDWQVAEDKLLAWVTAMAGLDAAHVAWDSAPVGMRSYPQVDLRLFDHRARDGMAPEVAYGEPDAGQMQPVAVAQRACSWSITVTTRDQRANAKAYVVLDALAVMLALPWSVEAFGSIGLAVLDIGRVIPNSDLPTEHRDLSQAVLTLELGYVTAVTVPAGLPGASTDVIEHAEVGGVAIDVTPIIIEPQIIPPL